MNNAQSWSSEDTWLTECWSGGQTVGGELVEYVACAVTRYSNPVQALRVPGSWGSQIARRSAHESGKVVNLMHRPPLPHRKYSWYSFLLKSESTPRPGVNRWKVSVTLSGIEGATSWFVAQCLNQLRHQVPPECTIEFIIWSESSKGQNNLRNLGVNGMRMSST